jgi:hypothetical protein
MGMFDIATEKKILSSVESIGFYFTKAIPHLNYDQYYFERDLGDIGIYSIVVEYNGDKYSLAYGIDYRVSMIKRQFELTFEEVIESLQEFAKTHRIVPLKENANE